MVTHQGSLLGMMVQNYRNSGTFNVTSATEVIKSIAETNLSPAEIASTFKESFLDATSFAEVTEDDKPTV